MAAQLDYGYSTPKGVAGGIYDIGDHDIFTRMNEEADGVLSYGVVVARGDRKGHGVKLPVEATTREELEGFVVNLPNTEQDMEGKTVVKHGRPLSIMREGYIWGRISPDCEPEYGKKVYAIKDGDYRGYVTDKDSEYTCYVQSAKGDEGAKEVKDSGAGGSTDINLANVTPVAKGYTPKVGDYVVNVKVHGETVYTGTTFGPESDVKNGIAVINI